MVVEASSRPYQPNRAVSSPNRRCGSDARHASRAGGNPEGQAAHVRRPRRRLRAGRAGARGPELPPRNPGRSRWLRRKMRISYQKRRFLAGPAAKKLSGRLGSVLPTAETRSGASAIGVDAWSTAKLPHDGDYRSLKHAPRIKIAEQAADRPVERGEQVVSQIR